MMDLKKELASDLGELVEVLGSLAAGGTTNPTRCMIYGAVEKCMAALKNGSPLFAAGNGGSYADAAHMVGELSGWYNDPHHTRPSLPVILLGANHASLTAIANDVGYNKVFSRELEGFLNAGIAKSGSVFVAFSTSGNSQNIIEAAKVAKRYRMSVVGFLGKDGGRLAGLCDYPIIVPSTSTARIQEVHHVLYHYFCRMIEKGCMKQTFLRDQ